MDAGERGQGQHVGEMDDVVNEQPAPHQDEEVSEVPTQQQDDEELAEGGEPEQAEEAAVEPVCPSCGAVGAPDARFCEECGERMDATATAEAEPAPVADELEAAPQRPCVKCGGAIAADGYCQDCGAPAASERDHFRLAPVPGVGGVCDRGILHRRNEDAMAIDVVGRVTAMVVCDGVSTAPDSDVASLAASRAALQTLIAAAPGGASEISVIGTARTSAWIRQHGEAAARASGAVLEVTPDGGVDAPSCTYSAAVVDGPLVVVATVGDSRAYWLPDAGTAAQLTSDDSWAQEMMAMGMAADQVLSSPHAHAITRWLGADAPELEPHTATFEVSEPGWLLLCSDGLWNYCPEPAELGALVRDRADALTEPDAVDVAAALVAWANEQGGRDNITAALVRLEPTEASAGD